MVAERIEQLMDELGADIAIKLKPHLIFSPKTIIKRRTLAEIMYEDYAKIHDVVVEPPEWAVDICRTTVLWDRPTRWSAGHRQFLRRCLLGAGLADDEVTHLWAWPDDDATGVPLESHVSLFRYATMAALDAANSRYIILLGATSQKMWRRELKLKQVQGKSGVWDRRYIVFPLANPLTIMRDPYLQGEWRQDVYRFVEMVRSGGEFDELGRSCVEAKCGDPVFMYDVDGVPWCQRHHDKNIKKRDRHQSISNVRTNSKQQETLL